ncbi:uncharacterized protein [Lepisosteus oculatus]|uniref:uncharacterized protein isoform X2 n=1 Tax=Lepisosteus oculatus TaxID=7918 RepID=UPI00074033B5|nr:PREDICTED: uncharacterized protein LOC107079875 isoform X2 [Lepisosteus oculatus]
MVYNTSIKRTRLCIAGMALFASLAIATCLVGLYVPKGGTKPLDPPCQRRIVQINGSVMSEFFKNMSKSFMLLEVQDTQPSGEYMEWKVKERISQNVKLDNSTTLKTEENGYYFVFVQVTFNISKNECRELNVFLDVQYDERVEQYSSTYKTFCFPANSTERLDAVISHPVLMWMEQNNTIRVRAKPMNLVDHQRSPVTTFMTVFKYADP